MISIRDPRLLSTVLVISLLVNGITLYELTLMYRKNSELINQVKTLAEQNENMSATIVNLIQEIDNLKSQVEYYKNQVDYYSSFVKKLEANTSVIGEAEINLVAVKTVYANFFDVHYSGLTLKCTVEIVLGHGRVLVNTVPRIGIDLQASAQTAVAVAEKFTGKPLSRSDIIITIEAEEEVQIVDGPSAGAALTIAIIAAIQGEKLSDKVFITGTIMSDGSIGRVGGVAEKAEAAAAKGGEIFLVPKGQSVITVYKRVEKQIAPGLTMITWEPIQVSLRDYLSQKGYNMSVYEVDNIAEAYNYFVMCS